MVVGCTTTPRKCQTPFVQAIRRVLICHPPNNLSTYHCNLFWKSIGTYSNSVTVRTISTTVQVPVVSHRNHKSTIGNGLHHHHPTHKRPRSFDHDASTSTVQQVRYISSNNPNDSHDATVNTTTPSKETEGNQTENSIPSIGAQIGRNGPSDSFISHITSGGTPCDPAPAPFQLADFGEESLYTLVLLRHGESEWNKLNQYTGWVDVNLTAEGKKEARDAGRLLHENGIEIDHAFTSVLKRASFSCNMALNTAQQHWVPVTKSWRLNERHYGALQGYNKDTAFRDLGLDQELVMQMRRSYDVRPPIMQDDHPYWHGNDRRYVLSRFLDLKLVFVLYDTPSHYSQISQTFQRTTGTK